MDFAVNYPRERFYASGILFSHYHGRCRPAAQLVVEHAFWNYPTGQRLAEGFFLDGVRCGKWKEFSENGEVLSIIDFGDGEYSVDHNVRALHDMAITPDTCILIEEEYGYRYHFWFPDIHLSEMEKWWREQFSIEPYITFSENARFTLPGSVLSAGDDINAFWMWNKLYEESSYWYCHFNDDDDSYLKSPSGSFVFNKSYEISQQYRLVL